MKLFATLAAVASADWNGVSSDNTCGMQIQKPVSMVNATCTFVGTSVAQKFAGNGAFIVDQNTFTGFDGASGEVDMVVFFDQDCPPGQECNNSTCWDADVSCTPNADGATNGVFFMETVNDHRGAKGGNFNLQIAGVAAGDVLTIELSDEFAAQNITAAFGTVNAETDNWGNQYTDTGSFTVTVSDDQVFGQLFQISLTQQPGQTAPLNLWESTVTA